MRARASRDGRLGLPSRTAPRSRMAHARRDGRGGRARRRRPHRPHDDAVGGRSLRGLRMRGPNLPTTALELNLWNHARTACRGAGRPLEAESAPDVAPSSRVAWRRHIAVAARLRRRPRADMGQIHETMNYTNELHHTDSVASTVHADCTSTVDTSSRTACKVCSLDARCMARRHGTYM